MKTLCRALGAALLAICLFAVPIPSEAGEGPHSTRTAAEMAEQLGLPLDWRPASQEEAELAAEALGLGKSCGSRCWDCSAGQCGGQQPCPFFSCTANCAAGHHPVCCYGCTPQPPPSGGGDCPPKGERDYEKTAAKIIELIELGDPGGILESCGSRCDKCNDCNRGGACPANGCCDPVDCWDNCLEKQHPVCCAGC